MKKGDAPTVSSKPGGVAPSHGAVRPLRRTDLPRDTVALSRFLLGKLLVRRRRGVAAVGRIVETEAYLQDDPACHGFRGPTARNRSLFLDVGHAYVYLCYGTSFLLNVASEGPGIGAGVLLRALEPLRGFARGADCARGPGRLTAALGIDRSLDGIDLFADGALWIGTDGSPTPAIGESTRIGLTKGADSRLRYFVPGSPCLSGTRRHNVPAA